METRPFNNTGGFHLRNCGHARRQTPHLGRLSPKPGLTTEGQEPALSAANGASPLCHPPLAPTCPCPLPSFHDHVPRSRHIRNPADSQGIRFSNFKNRHSRNLRTIPGIVSQHFFGGVDSGENKSRLGNLQTARSPSLREPVLSKPKEKGRRVRPALIPTCRVNGSQWNRNTRTATTDDPTIHAPKMPISVGNSQKPLASSVTPRSASSIGESGR